MSTDDCGNCSMRTNWWCEWYDRDYSDASAYCEGEESVMKEILEREKRNKKRKRHTPGGYSHRR